MHVRTEDVGAGAPVAGAALDGLVALDVHGAILGVNRVCTNLRVFNQKLPHLPET